MQSRKTLIASISSLILAAGTAYADITTFSPPILNTGDWDIAFNWDNGVPTADDRAVIPAGKTCNITDDAIADTIDVQGTLVILGGNTLTLENDTDNITLLAIADHSIVDGLVTLAGAEEEKVSGTYIDPGWHWHLF